MKKIIAVVLLIALCLTALVGCTQTVPTRSVKWDVVNGEELTYDVRVVHSLQQVNETGTISADASLLNELDDKYLSDQVKPISVNGTYHTSAYLNEGEADQQKITTKLDIIELYDRSNISDEMFTQLLNKNMLALDATTDQYIAIKTIITTETICHYPSLNPISTQRTNLGVYIGTQYCGINDFVVKTTFANDVYTIDYVDNMNNSNNFKKSAEKDEKIEYFDNDILYYVARSYDSDTLTAKTTINILEPTVEKDILPLYLQQTTYNTYFSDEFSDTLKVYVISTTSMPLIYYYLTTEEPPIFINGAPKTTNKILKMQQGYLVFTLCDSDLQVAIDNINSTAK